MSSEEEQYAAEATGNAEASLTFPTQASALRKNGYVLMKSHPCKILEISTAKPGKHGHAKCTFKGRDIFTGALVEDSHPSSHNMEVPVVKKTEWDVSHVQRDGFLVLFGANGEKADVKLPDNEVGVKIKTLLAEDKPVGVTILAAMGQELCVDAKALAED